MISQPIQGAILKSYIVYIFPLGGVYLIYTFESNRIQGIWVIYFAVVCLLWVNLGWGREWKLFGKGAASGNVGFSFFFIRVGSSSCGLGFMWMSLWEEAIGAKPIKMRQFLSSYSLESTFWNFRWKCPIFDGHSYEKATDPVTVKILSLSETILLSKVF